jgi:hypothetical protein
MPFQNTTPRQYLAPGVEGGWASFNPHVSLLQPNTGDLSEANAASWKVGLGGAIVGRFAFADVVTGQVTSAHPGTGANFVEGSNGQPGRVRVGFVQRDQISLITVWLGENGNTVQPGAGITLITRGDVWARFAAGAAVGSFVFASYADGSAIAGATSTPPTATGVTATTTSGSPNITAVTGGTLLPGQPVSGTGIPAGTYIVSVSGTTAVLSANATASGTGVAITQTTAFLTQWRVDSLAAAGDIAKISVWG